LAIAYAAGTLTSRFSSTTVTATIRLFHIAGSRFLAVDGI